MKRKTTKIHERSLLGGMFLEGNRSNNSEKEEKQVVREKSHYVSATSTAIQTALASLAFVHESILWTICPFIRY